MQPHIPSEEVDGRLRCVQEEVKQPLQVIAQVQAAFAKALAAIAGVVGALIGAVAATSGFTALQHRCSSATPLLPVLLLHALVAIPLC